MTPGVAFLTLRSDGMDKYAQADGRFIGKPGTPTGVSVEGPELKGPPTSCWAHSIIARWRFTPSLPRDL